MRCGKVTERELSLILEMVNPGKMFPLTPPSPHRGEGKGEGRFGHLEFGTYL